MNFVGKFDAKLHVDGSGPNPVAHYHVDSVTAHAPTDAIIVPDADLLFNGDFKRSGVDLIVSRDDHELVVQDYFKGEKRAALASPDGAHLTGDIVNALAGHVEYAQADGSAGAGKVIGHVTKLTGTATAIRNGVSIILNQGDNVEKGDVVQSGSGSTLGVTFIDGTVFGLSANARMVLNEMVYDPNGSNNSSLISLVAGTISFVAGQTAKHGDMKIDTPVATMGIRGTAVLVEIDFDVPGQNGAPEAKFQVLVEPDGTTGSYILFDKNTLAPIAVVDKAGQQVHISNNNVSFSDSPLTPELQKLITDVFTLKFSQTNPQSFTHVTDTLTPQQTLLPVQLANDGPPAIVHVTITPIASLGGTSSSGPAGNNVLPHVNKPPVVTTVDTSLTEHAGVTGSAAIDTTSGTISFADINLGDRPTAKAAFSTFTYQNAQQQDIKLNPLQLADIKALEVPLVVVQAPGNTFNGTATWTYSVPDKAFDFLGAGETLTLTYMAEVDSNFAGGNLATLVPFTITITGTNDAPVITTGPEKVAFVNVGTGTPGPSLPPVDPTTTTNTLKFKDPDLTDTHTVSTDLTAATLSGTGISTLDMQALETKFPRPMGVFESALSAAVTTDSTGTGAGTITWTLADISSYYADIVPAGETLTLTYTVTVKDSQGATSSQNVIVTITGSEPPAVVWVETTNDALTDAAPGDWNGAHNWETGTVPIATDDVIIITNQLQGQTPFYPVTIKAGGAAAFAHSVTMNDFANTPAELDNHNILAIGDGGLSLSADSILKNFGTLSVGSIASLLGKAEISGQSDLENSGSIKLYQGGDFKDQGSIKNFGSGTIEVAGGTLNVLVDIANSGGTLQIDNGATLKLSSVPPAGDATPSSTTITGGNLTLGSGSVLDVESSGGATLDGVTVTGTNASTEPTVAASLIEVGITGSSTLTLDDGTSIENGTLNITAGSTLDIDNGTTGPGATLDGVTVVGVDGATPALASTIAVGAHTVSGAILTLDDGTTITNGNLTIASGNALDIEGIGGATLDGVTVSGGDAINVDGTTDGPGSPPAPTPATLTLIDGTSITGGTLTNGSVGTLDIEKGATPLAEGMPDATLDNVTILGGGAIEVSETTEGAILTLTDGTTVTDGSLDVATGGEVYIQNGSGSVGATLDHVTVTGGGEIEIGKATSSGSTLILSDGTTISGVTLTLDDKTDVVDLEGSTIIGGKLIIAGDLVSTGSSFINGATITNTGTIDVTGGTLTIDAASTIDNSTGTIETNGGHLIIDAALSGNIEIKGAATVELGACAPSAYSATTVTFDSGSTGTLTLDHSQDFHGTISGFSAGDKIDLTDLAYSTSETDVWNSATDTLTIYNGTHSSSLIFSGSYSQNSFALTRDASGHTEVVLSPAQASLTGLDSADDAVNGYSVTASLTDSDACNVTYQWLDNGLPIENATGAGYTPTASDLGKVLDVVIGFTDDGHTEHITALAGTVADASAVNFSGGTPSTDENAPLTLNGLNVSFADAGSDTIHVTLDVNDGTLALANTTGVTESGAGTTGSPLILTGTLDAIDTALGGGVVYTPTTGYFGSDTLSVTASDGAFHSNTASVTINVAPPATTVTITVDTSEGLDFQHQNPLAEMGAGTIQPGGTSTSFTIVDVDADHNLEFTLDGNGFTYGSDGHGGITVTGGTLTSFHEFMADATTPIADFTGLSVNAATWITDVQLAATGDHSAIDALTSTFAYNFVGGSGPDIFGSAGQVDTLSGTGADVFDGGGAPGGSHDTLTGGAGSTFVFAQGYGALTITNFDQDGNGDFSQSIGDHIELNGLAAPLSQNVSYANGNAILDFGNGDVVTLLHVTQTEYEGLGGTEFTNGNNSGPILNSFTPNVTQGGTDVLTTADFDVTHPQSSDFFSMPLHSVTGGEFEVTQDGGETWPSAPTGGFTIAQIEAGEVRFVQDGSATVPDFSIWISDGTGNVSPAIAPMVSLEIAGPNAETITFAGSSGTLQLDNPSSFTGEIKGISGTGDVLDMHGFAAATTKAVTGTDSYDSDSNITALTVTDSSLTQPHSETFKLVGDYSGSTWTVTPDGHGGVDIVDPPAPAGMVTTSTIIASVPNQILTGHAASDTFAFNFTDVGHTTVTDFHPATDTLQFTGQLFSDVQAALNATHDDGHGNTVIALDAHDTITLNGILKAQLQASDFHFV